MNQIPAPTPEQSHLIVQILEKWTARGWTYSAGPVVAASSATKAWVFFTDPDGSNWNLSVFGVSHFDALCQATAIMQVLLEEHPARAD